MATYGKRRWTVLQRKRIMIFVTVGTQLPFDRLIQGMDNWARTNQKTEVFAQIAAGAYKPVNMAYKQNLSPDIFQKKCAQADLIVSHAGIGNLLLSLELQKPIVLVPRRFSYKEHRNDHQMATAKWLEDRPGVYIAYEIEELDEKITLARDMSVNMDFSPFASFELIDTIKNFIDQS